MNKNNLNLETIEVLVNKQVFYNSKNEFHIYVGDYKSKDKVFPTEISIKTFGFSLNGNGQKKLNGYFGKPYNGQETFVCYSEEIDMENEDTKLNILCQVKGLGLAKACAILEMLEKNKLNISIFKDENKWDKIPEIKTIGKTSRNNFFPEIKNILNKLDNNDILQKLKLLLTGKLNGKKINILSNILNCEFSYIPIEIKKDIKIYELEINEDKKDLAPFYKHPYKFLIEILECSFNQADKIALEILKIDKNSRERLIFLSEYLLNREILQTGSTYVSRETFENIINQNNLVNDVKEFLDDNEKIENEDNNVFPKNLYYYEKSIAENIKYFSEKQDNFSSERIKKMISFFEHKNKIKYDNSQIEAIISCVNSGISIITGGAGCGKTTVLKCIMYVLKNCAYSFTLTAPTGKASVRMAQATNNKAGTLHSFYYQNFMLDDFENDFTNDDMCLVVDEVSMCDVEITAKILNLVNKMNYEKVILIGDPFQLPSVGAGNVLKDLIDSKFINVAYLNTIHRQGKENSIINFSLDVRSQKRNEFNNVDGMLYCQKALKEDDYIKNIFKFYNYIKNKEEYKNDLDLFYNDVQIIIPMKQGIIGVNNINTLIKQKYNPGFYEEGKIKYEFCLNDKVMCIKNKKDKNVFNGDVGRIVEINKEGFKVYFSISGKIVYFESSERNDFKLAYVCTVHKLQGSEYKFVICIFNNNNPLVDSCLLYTAVTRAKHTAILISNKEIINKIISKKNLNNRNTKLVDRMEENFNVK